MNTALFIVYKFIYDSWDSNWLRALTISHCFPLFMCLSLFYSLSLFLFLSLSLAFCLLIYFLLSNSLQSLLSDTGWQSLSHSLHLSSSIYLRLSHTYIRFLILFYLFLSHPLSLSIYIYIYVYISLSLTVSLNLSLNLSIYLPLFLIHL